MNLAAIVFDFDGVFAETELDIHRVAFNRAFRDAGLLFQWDVALYGELLKVSGGKERMKAYFKQRDWTPPEDMDAYVKKLHSNKREHFEQIVLQGEVQPRPGITRLVKEAGRNAIPVGIASTAHPDSIRTFIKHVLGEDFLESFQFILGGDVVKRKKPDPEIYNLACEKFGVQAGRCVVIEDTENGHTAAKRAGMVTVVTPSYYSMDEDFSAADMVVSCLGVPEGPYAERIKAPESLPEFQVVTIQLLDHLVGIAGNP